MRNRCIEGYHSFLISRHEQYATINMMLIFIAVTLHTDVGDIKIELFCERTPKTCENFLALCASNYYNGCIFHRNIKGFMVQTGDPLGTGKGGNSIWGKKFEDEFSEYLKHSVRGVVSMANNGPNTNGSQFFITYGKQPHLDMKYTVFGKVIDGLETLDELEKLPVNEKTYRPLNDVRIKDITIHANPFALTKSRGKHNKEHCKKGCGHKMLDRLLHRKCEIRQHQRQTCTYGKLIPEDHAQGSTETAQPGKK
ncbi:hypothetical protein IHE44_0014318 [Lamprotornis superbus]|uniref:Peptidyl-prolyl cis-trans isomerase n=8 Tax=Telluraves TaxID=3073808 RepID=A0A835P1D4_9PASS|nr:hypothetical protein IHE44_0014318 [Lamprotornis superbus]